MAIRIVQLGSPRSADEGLRIGTVRRPPRGVPKAEFASRNYYDTWLPELSPQPDLMQQAQAAVQLRASGNAADVAAADKAWRAFDKAFRQQLADAPTARTLDLLAALSRQTHFAIGCYCDDEAQCHRSILRAVLADKGAQIAN